MPSLQGMAKIQRTPQGLVLTADLPPEATGAIIVPMVGETPGLPVRAVTPPIPTPPPLPTPTPTPPDIRTATMMVVNGQGFVLDGVDRPRATNEVILYTKGATAPVNMWGTDVGIVAGKVVTVVARERDKVPAETPIPVGGVVVSGHGAQGSRMAAAIHVGDEVIWRYDNATPSTPTPGLASALIGTYVKVWRTDRVRAADLPAGANALFLAFVRNSPGSAPSLLGDPSAELTAFGTATLRGDLAKLRGSGVEIGVSLGGAQGGIFFDNPTTFVDGLMRTADKIGGFTLLDIDCEQGVLSPKAVMAVDDELSRRMPGVRWTAAPNGSYANAYLPVSAELARRGKLRYHAQQYYEGTQPITADDVRWRLQQALDAKIPASALGIGMMVGGTYQYWTADQCQAMYELAVREFGARHAYVWDIAQTGTAEVIARTRHVLETTP